MSQFTNEDIFSCMISFLDINTMENLSESTEENKKVVGKYQHIYYKNYLSELWGNELLVILEKSGFNLRKDIKNIYDEYKNNNITTVKKILQQFYKCVGERTLKFNNDVFMFIYDICYTIISSQEHESELRLSLFTDRELFFSTNEIVEGSRQYKFIKNSTRYVDRWVNGED